MNPNPSDPPSGYKTCSCHVWRCIRVQVLRACREAMCRCWQHVCSLGICGVCRSSPTGAGAAATEAKGGNAWNTLSLARASATASGNASIAGWAGAAAGIAPVQVTRVTCCCVLWAQKSNA